jgi:hypothetical protein
VYAPTKEQINEWKTKYNKIYCILFETYQIAFRVLSLNELNSIPDFEEPKLEDYLIRKCVLFPTNIFDLCFKYPGLCESLIYKIKSGSGMIKDEIVELMDRLDTEIENDGSRQMISVILSVFPGYDKYKLYNLPQTEIIELYSMAKWSGKLMYGFTDSKSQQQNPQMQNPNRPYNPEDDAEFLRQSIKLDPKLNKFQKGEALKNEINKEHEDILKRYQEHGSHSSGDGAINPLFATPQDKWRPLASDTGEIPHKDSPLYMTPEEFAQHTSSKRKTIKDLGTI